MNCIYFFLILKFQRLIFYIFCVDTTLYTNTLLVLSILKLYGMINCNNITYRYHKHTNNRVKILCQNYTNLFRKSKNTL